MSFSMYLNCTKDVRCNRMFSLINIHIVTFPLSPFDFFPFFLFNFHIVLFKHNVSLLPFTYIGNRCIYVYCCKHWITHFLILNIWFLRMHCLFLSILNRTITISVLALQQCDDVYANWVEINLVSFLSLGVRY